MTAVITALVGLLGVLVGALLSSLLQRRNWQRQEAMKAYAALFAEGEREIQLCDAIGYAGAVGDDALIDAADDQLPGFADSPFLQFLARCWLLERNSDIRQCISDLEPKFRDMARACRASAQTWKLEQELESEGNASMRKMRQQKLALVRRRADTGPQSEDVRQLLEDLRASVARKYFHGESSRPLDEETGEEGARD